MEYDRDGNFPFVLKTDGISFDLLSKVKLRKNDIGKNEFKYLRTLSEIDFFLPSVTIISTLQRITSCHCRIVYENAAIDQDFNDHHLSA